MGITAPQFFEIIHAERTYQAQRWGDGSEASLDRTDLEKNDPFAFASYIALHSSRWHPGGFPPYNGDTLAKFRVQMQKVGALCYAAWRWTRFRMGAQVAMEALFVEKLMDIATRKMSETQYNAWAPRPEAFVTFINYHATRNAPGGPKIAIHKPALAAYEHEIVEACYWAWIAYDWATGELSRMPPSPKI